MLEVDAVPGMGDHGSFARTLLLMHVVPDQALA